MQQPNGEGDETTATSVQQPTTPNSDSNGHTEENVPQETPR